MKYYLHANQFHYYKLVCHRNFLFLKVLLLWIILNTRVMLGKVLCI